MASRRCNYCERNWPHESDYAECPVCREQTHISYVPPQMTSERATEVRQSFAFGWWLWDTGRL